MKVDDEVRIVVRQHPDQVGNVNSPLASIFEIGSFIGSITELSLIAEVSRTRPRIVTQIQKKDATGLDPSNLFFDAESRAIQSGADVDESIVQARALHLQQSMCEMINRLQTRQHTVDHDNRSFGGTSTSKVAGKQISAPSEITPSLFTVPKGQEIVPHTSTVESRTDLESLMRLGTEQFCASLGVPSDLIFSGRFAGKSTSQLSLLNITVSQLAKAVNNVMTLCYRDIYGEGSLDDLGQLQLLTSPLAATEEVLNLFKGGLVPVELAMPSVLHSIGATKEDIDAAVQKALKKEEEVNRNNSELSMNNKSDAINPETQNI
jgi:hypothetical protein